MEFIVQRHSDRKYHGGVAGWVQSEHDAHPFPNQLAAETFCDSQNAVELDMFDILMRLRTGELVLFDAKPREPKRSHSTQTK